MTIELNETHEPSLRSWVASANVPDTDFPIQNLPFCVFRPRRSGRAYRGGVAIGDQILDLAVLGNGPGNALDGASLNGLMTAGPAAWSALRLALSRLLRSDAAPLASSCVPGLPGPASPASALARPRARYWRRAESTPRSRHH